MEMLAIVTVVFITSILTFFSGFGLGMVLLPVIALFFPMYLAIAITAIVHFFNNLLKLTLLRKNTNTSIFIQFGIPAVIAAFLGAGLLSYFALNQITLSYKIINYNYSNNLINIIVGLLLIFFASFELLPLHKIKITPIKLTMGGVISGFLGGLSGLQGALRSAILIRLKLGKKEFIATNAAIALVTDFARIIIYSTVFYAVIPKEQYSLILYCIFSAFIGTFISNKYLNKISYNYIKILITLMLYIFGIFYCAGTIGVIK